MADMVRIFNTACKEWWLPGHGSGMTDNIAEAWVLPLEQAQSLAYGSTVLSFEPVNSIPPAPDELVTARASEAMLREALEVTYGDLCHIQTAAALAGLPPRVYAGFGGPAKRALSGSSGEWLERQLAEAVAAERERADSNFASYERVKAELSDETKRREALERHDADKDTEIQTLQWKLIKATERAEKAEAERDTSMDRAAQLDRQTCSYAITVRNLEAERDGLAAVIANEHGTEYVSNPDLARILAARDARITATARRKALLEVAEAALEKYGASPTQHWLAKMAQGADHA